MFGEMLVEMVRPGFPGDGIVSLTEVVVVAGAGAAGAGGGGALPSAWAWASPTCSQPGAHA